MLFPQIKDGKAEIQTSLVRVEKTVHHYSSDACPVCDCLHGARWEGLPDFSNQSHRPHASVAVVSSTLLDAHLTNGTRTCLSIHSVTKNKLYKNHNCSLLSVFRPMVFANLKVHNLKCRCTFCTIF